MPSLELNLIILLFLFGLLCLMALCRIILTLLDKLNDLSKDWGITWSIKPHTTSRTYIEPEEAGLDEKII